MKLPLHTDLTSYYILTQHAADKILVLSSKYQDLSLAIAIDDTGEPTFSLMYGTDEASQEMACAKLFDSQEK